MSPKSDATLLRPGSASPPRGKFVEIRGRTHAAVAWRGVAIGVCMSLAARFKIHAALTGGKPLCGGRLQRGKLMLGKGPDALAVPHPTRRVVQICTAIAPRRSAPCARTPPRQTTDRA